ncbi:MAG TPA: serine hydrolase domain-containing protein, partial [Thermoanaerobaculia bacterium]|nr:serine hydrolase domain-containing protein [Thermoanaerobaculia bacterium]
MKALRSLALSVCLLVSFAAAAQPYDDKLRDFEAFAQQQLKAANMPGLSVAVMKDDFVWSKGFGFADVENQVQATAESSYRLASVTKPMTATAMLKLAEEGTIDLDAEVQTYVPTFPRKQWPITVRQLLGHLGGIPHYRDAGAELHFREPKNTAEALAVFRDFDLVAEPGTRYSYSSYGYVLLGAIIEGATGKPYAQVMREKVWGPLGMIATRMDDPRAVIAHRVRGYELRDGKLRNSEYVDVSSRFAAGGTRSTVVDMLAFVRGLDADKVLKRETLERMWTAQATKDGRATRYGLGWEIHSLAGRFAVFHDGAQAETNTYLVYVPRVHFAIALATNLEAANLNVFADRLALLFLGDDWASRMWIRGSRGDQAAGVGILSAFNAGFAYYDRYGRASTTDAKELANAFRALNESVDGKQAPREELVKVGSHIAHSLAPHGLERYHHEGPFAFFADYD